MRNGEGLDPMTGEPVAVGGPPGRDRLVDDLRSLGLRPGQDLLIQCSLRQVGPVEGGAAALFGAIREAAGPAATLVVPTQTTGNSLSSRAFHAATAGLSAEGRARYVAAMPGFDPGSTPSVGMGALAEYIRTYPGARRSAHPQSSFAAVGPRAAQAMSVHDLDCHLGDRSPLGWLYGAAAAILLIGVGYAQCTAFHLAEYRWTSKPRRQEYHCFTVGEGTRTALAFTDIELDDSDFELIGAALDAASWSGPDAAPRRGRVGRASCALLPMRTAVDFACASMARHRANKERHA
jgi:aminoglycoside N3'-acetyltransferase